MFCFKQTSPKFDEDEFLENDQMEKIVYCELKFNERKGFWFNWKSLSEKGKRLDTCLKLKECLVTPLVGVENNFQETTRST